MVTFDLVFRTRTRMLTRPIIARILRYATRVAPTSMHLSIAFIDDRVMSKWNMLYRHIPFSTDVLSFRYSPHEGEIIISAPRVRAQARTFGHSIRTEAAFLLVHGYLHLLGWDHERSHREASSMRKHEIHILQQCRFPFAR